MACIRFLTTAPPETILDVAYRQAKKLGFDVAETDNLRLVARRGSIALSVLLGAFVAYCDFRLEVGEFKGDNELSLSWTVPWWTGLIGVGRTKGEAKKLLDAIGDVLEEKGFEVFDDNKK
jgi:hypothetical protein